MKSSDKSSLCGVLLVEHFGRDAATPVGHARGRCCLSRIHSITHQVGETLPHARVLANKDGWLVLVTFGQARLEITEG